MRRIKLADGTVKMVAIGSEIPVGATVLEDVPAEKGADDLETKVQAAVEKALRTIKGTSNADGITTAGADEREPEPAVRRASTAETARFRSVSGGRDAAEGKGINVARMLKALGVAKMTGQKPSAVAKGWGYERVSKALLQGDFDAGGSLVHEQFSSEIIELLRNAAVIRRAGARQIPMPGGNLTIGRQGAAATAYYGQENTATTPSQPSTEEIKLSEKKLTALVPVSNDLIRNASVGAEEMVRDDLVNVIALREDLAFLRGTGASSEPQGLRYKIHADHVYAETTATDGAPTLVEAKAEFNKAVQKLKTANIKMVRPAWIMAARTEAAILDITGPGGEGTNSLEREMLEKGTIRGFPYYVTEQVPTNLVDTESELYFIDLNEVVIGDSMALELAVFPDGHYSSAGSVLSGISNDFTVIRAISKHDITMRHTKGGVCVTTLTWNE